MRSPCFRAAVTISPTRSRFEQKSLNLVGYKPESVVVHRRQHDVAHPGAHRQAAERVRVEFLRRESRRELFVFSHGNRLAVEHPLSPLQQAIHAEMNEHSVSRLDKPIEFVHV